MGRLGNNAERDGQIYCRRNDGLPFRAIALEFALSPATIRVIVKQMERKAMWLEIERNALEERVISLMISLTNRTAVGR